MATTLSATLQAMLSVVETADSTVSPASALQGSQRKYSAYDKSLILNATSFPPVGGQVADFSTTLVAADKDWDLLLCPWAGDITKTFSATTKKPVAMIFHAAKANNAAGLVIKPQGVNAYHLFGSATNQILLYPGHRGVLFLDGDGSAFVNNYTAIGAGAKDFRYSGTIGDIIEMLMIFSL